ncbi:MAG: SRPBCC family protein [Chitinophagales bacterium]|nr:SRPBCC family protein [Chitinophagales bacterium]
MSIAKNLIIAFLVILVIAGAGIYFLPNTYTLTNSIEINRPVQLVYGQVADFKKWPAWSPWHEKEPTAKFTYDGAPNTEGQKMSWDGEKVGAGYMTLVVAGENEALVCSDVFTRPMDATAKDYWRFEANGDKTNVVWITSGGLKYPFGRLFGLAVDKVVGEDERKGLANLKKVCEAMEMPAPPVATVDTLDSLRNNP